MQFYFKRDEVVFEHGGGNQVLAQDPKPKCPELDLLFPELDLGQADTSLNLLLCLQKQTSFGNMFWFIMGNMLGEGCEKCLTLKSWLSRFSTTRPLKKGKQRRKKSCKKLQFPTYQNIKINAGV